MSHDLALSSEAEALVHSHLGLAKAIAHRIANARGRVADREDLVSFGFLGLVLAARKFCKSYGVRFVTYAYPRIYGAIIDGMAKLCPLSRGTYRSSRGQIFVSSLDEQNVAKESTEQPNAEELLQTQEQHRKLYELLAQLPSDSRILLFEFYFADTPLSKTAAKFGHSKSWASRKHKQALGDLAQAFNQQQ